MRYEISINKSSIKRICLGLTLSITFLLCSATWVFAQGPFHLHRSLDSLTDVTIPQTSETTKYQAIFGDGDIESEITKGVTRYGVLNIEPNGSSMAGAYYGEELVYYVLEGTGILGYGGQEVPISKDDFFYLPVGVDHRFSNPREIPMQIIVMGFLVDSDLDLPRPVQTPELQIANSDDVVTSETGFQLLLGATTSQRDRLAVGQRVISLFIINIDSGGANNTHRHENQEEIYFMLEGHGEMIAGNSEGEPEMYPTMIGDSFFITRNSPIGFQNNPDSPARILAVRSNYPEVE